MNEVYRTFFPTEPPARTTVAVAALPVGARIEVECVALAGTGAR
jgi:2-iminobutanoate/2-iminopropanoate deaminase